MRLTGKERTVRTNAFIARESKVFPQQYNLYESIWYNRFSDSPIPGIQRLNKILLRKIICSIQNSSFVLKYKFAFLLQIFFYVETTSFGSWLGFQKAPVFHDQAEPSRARQGVRHIATQMSVAYPVELLKSGFAYVAILCCLILTFKV